MISLISNKQKGYAVVSKGDIPNKTVVISSQIIKIQDHRDLFTLQHNDRHIIMDAPATYINHSCEPNCAVQANRSGAFDFVSTRDIAAGDEICFDYLKNEDEIASPFFCLCGSLHCRGYIFKKYYEIETDSCKAGIIISVEKLATVLRVRNVQEKISKEYTVQSLMNTYNNTLGEKDELTDHLNDQDISIASIDVNDKELNLIFSNNKKVDFPLSSFASF